MLLALDTSTSTASIAAIRDGRLAAEMTWDVGRRHSQELVARLSQLLDVSHATPADVSSIAVALGPGSFNGIRVGIATAGSLAFALGARLVGSPTLDVIAFGHAHHCGMVCAVLEAGRGEAYAAWYASLADGRGEPPVGAVAQVTERLWRVSDYMVSSPHAVAHALGNASEEPLLLCGEWRPETRAAFEAELAGRVTFASALDVRRASWLAGMTLERAEMAGLREPDTIEPLYLRRPAITVSKKHPALGRAAVELGEGQAADSGEEDARALRR
jgi:tRNA threonylcarbamoyladenosine biosynthesis protein TsaB